MAQPVWRTGGQKYINLVKHFAFLLQAYIAGVRRCTQAYAGAGRGTQAHAGARRGTQGHAGARRRTQAYKGVG